MDTLSIVVDENIPRRTVNELRSIGYAVHDIGSGDTRGIDDAAIWRLAQEKHALIVSTDKAFARPRSEPHSGVLVVRLRQPNSDRIHRRVLHALQ
jgi:predicted nuclease of predicted toxin-antitoxin system